MSLPSIRFACPHCGKTIRVAADMAGSAGKCPRCRKRVEVPEGRAAPPPKDTQAATKLQVEAARSGLSIGQVLLGRYEVRQVLGRGAMGEVLEVRDRQGGSDYALKRVPPDLARDSGQMKSIRANFALVSHLAHPHIATTRHLEIDRESGEVYLLLELVRGIDLAEWLGQKRDELGNANAPLPLELALGIAEQIAVALDHAHSQPASRGADGKPKSYGILHRDLKPANVMLERGREYRPGVPYVKLVDFGLAAEIQASLMSLSIAKSDKIAGTPAYMAPEQWEGRTLTRGVDQWALAAIQYEIVAGRRPFNAPTETALMSQILKATPEPPAGMTPRQWSVFQTAFQVDRRKRHRSCLAFVKALAEADRATRGTIEAAAVRMPEEFSGDQSSSALIPISRAPRRMGWVVAAMIVALLVALGGGFGWWRHRESEVRSAIAEDVAAHEGARLAHGAQLERAISSLRDLRAKYAERPASDLAALSSIEDGLSRRKEALEKRSGEFARIVAEAEAEIGANRPDEALRLLAHAQELGRADREKGLPELGASLAVSLTSLEAIAMERRDEIVSQQKAERQATEDAQAKTEFLAGYQAAKDAMARDDWEAAHGSLAGALEILGETKHAARPDAETLLVRIREEIERRRADAERERAFADKMTRGGESEAAGEYLAAYAAYAEARKIWPDSPRLAETREAARRVWALAGDERTSLATDDPALREALEPLVLDEIEPAPGSRVYGDRVVFRGRANRRLRELRWSAEEARIDGETFEVEVALSDGTIEYQVVATDEWVGTCERSVSYTGVTKPPAFVDLAPKDGHETQAASIVIKGRLSDAAGELRIGDAAATWESVAADGTFSRTVSLVEGDNRVVLAARNPAGVSPESTIRIFRRTPTAPPPRVAESPAPRRDRPPDGKTPSNEGFDPWARFAAGSWVKYTMTASENGELTKTLHGITKTGYTIVTNSWRGGVQVVDNDVLEVGFLAFDGKETLNIEGTEYACTIWKCRIGAIGGTDDPGTERVWISADGQTLKTANSMGQLVATKVGEPVRVADRTFDCVRLEGTQNPGDGDKHVTKWATREVPGGMVKFEIVDQRYQQEFGVSTKTTFVLAAYEAKPAKR